MTILSNSGARCSLQRGLARVLAIAAVASGVIGLTAASALAEQRCSGAPAANVCLEVVQLSNGNYDVVIGIDYHVGLQDAQAIIDCPGDPFNALVIGDDGSESENDRLFIVPMTNMGASAEFGLSADFHTVVFRSQLDEDDGTDEVFGRVVLVDCRVGTRIFDTPRIVRKF